MNRKQLIEELTRYELEWFLENNDKHSLTEIAEFFSNGGFTDWSDSELQTKYDLFIKEDNHATI